ncbi:MAG: hypothetical protein HS113_26600 [Verrucomicrobiales bacterium]|nr:hypothetical protein [Verrucomicrobiales bacterium]
MAHFTLYRWPTNLLVDRGGRLRVNWCELTVTGSGGQVLYHNAWITDSAAEPNVAAVVARRARWKIENENNNTLKTKGYHLEHNSVTATNICRPFLLASEPLAFLSTPSCSHRTRLPPSSNTLPSRQTFFDDLRASPATRTSPAGRPSCGS